MSAASLILSSGDPTVDRRIEWARALMEEGNAPDAASLLAEAVKRVPGHAPGWFLLGEARETAGDSDGAGEAFGRALALDPEDLLGAGLRRARLFENSASATLAGADMSAAYVRTLFDQYADRFDSALARLNYRGPEAIDAALSAACARLARPYAFARALDLGCGTGLVAAQIAQHVGALEGVDLSPKMIALAAERGLYESLIAGDMLEFVTGRETGGVDLIVAGDAFCYLNDLAPILTACARSLEDGGLLAFTVETHEDEGVLLRDTLRFAHGEGYVRAALEAAGLLMISCEAQSTRTEKDADVPGLVVVALR